MVPDGSTHAYTARRRPWMSQQRCSAGVGKGSDRSAVPKIEGRDHSRAAPGGEVGSIHRAGEVLAFERQGDRTRVHSACVHTNETSGRLVRALQGRVSISPVACAEPLLPASACAQEDHGATDHEEHAGDLHEVGAEPTVLTQPEVLVE